MNVYDELTGELLTSVDLKNGTIYTKKRFVSHHDEVPENFTYEVMPGTEELNDGKGLRGKVIITPYQAAYDEYEDVLVYRQNGIKTESEMENDSTKEGG